MEDFIYEFEEIRDLFVTFTDSLENSDYSRVLAGIIRKRMNKLHHDMEMLHAKLNTRIL